MLHGTANTANTASRPDLSNNIRVFVPRSKVLLERKLLTFDSDNDEEESLSNHQRTASPVEVDDAATTGAEVSELAYAVGGLLESVRLDCSWRDALEQLPTDTWTTLLDDEDRRKLHTFLPNLEGWSDHTNADAQCANVEALIRGENFHFGNPLTEFNKRVQSGLHSEKATRAQLKANVKGARRFQAHGQATMRSTIKELNQKLPTELPDDHYPAKKPRLDPEIRFIQKATPDFSLPLSTTVEITREESIFLAIRSILVKQRSASHDVATALQTSHPQFHKALIDFPVVLSFSEFVDASLRFLSDTSLGETHGDSLADPLVRYNEDSATYEWIGHPRGIDDVPDDEVLALLVLERVFRAPLPKMAMDFSKDSSAVKGTRRRRELGLIRQAQQRLLEHDPVYAQLRAVSSSHPSLLLKQSLVPRNPILTDEQCRSYQEQELQRYKHADVPFVFVVESGERYVVGPAVQEQRIAGMEERLLIANRPAAVTLVSLVYDACACLHNSRGTRADIKANFRRSRFLKTDVTEGAIDECIAVALDLLEHSPPRESKTSCVAFVSADHSWVYRHSDHVWPDAIEPTIDAPGTTPGSAERMSMRDLLH